MLHVNGEILLQLLGDLLIYPFLHIFIGKANGIFDCLGTRPAMAYHPHTIDSQQRSTAVLGVIHFLFEAGKGLLKYLGIESLLVTLGEDGMCLFEAGKDPHHIPTRAREVFDVSGAGDTVISVFTLAIAAGATKRQAADIANHAAGIVVAKMGAAAVSPEELVRSLNEDK